MISNALSDGEHCSPQNYVSGEDSVPVYLEINEDDWDLQFHSSLSNEEENITEEQIVHSDEKTDIPPPKPKIKSYKEAVQSFEEVVFLENMLVMTRHY